MMSHVLHLLLIANIVACPLLCTQGVCRCRDECADSHTLCVDKCAAACHLSGSLCDHRGSGDTNPPPFGPEDRPRGDGCTGCQCICGGAVLNAGVELDVASLRVPMFDALIDQATTAVACNGASHPGRAGPNAWSLDDGYPLTGQAVRLWRQSLLL